MKLISIASAFPEHKYNQQQCLKAMRNAEFWSGLKEGSRRLLEKVLQSDGGIDERRFALSDLTDAWKRDAQELNHYYEKAAPAIAEKAVLAALKKTDLNITDIDALFVCSCTGYLCPGVSSYVAERLGMRENAYLQDLTGLGCGAAIPMLEAAAGYIALNPDAKVLTAAVEICSAAFYVEDDAGVLISTCIFGDGASAAIWSGTQGDWEIKNFKSIHCPENREMIRFTNAAGKLRNQLDKNVPALAASVVKRLYQERSDTTATEITHGGGRDVIVALETELEIETLSYAREVMRKYGNLSSPSVLVALELFLDQADQATTEENIWMCTFGAGFSAHACELNRVRS